MKTSPKPVLVVDDETDLRNFASRVLELEGYRVLQAVDGTDALKVLNRNKIDLVLLDLQMPGMDGWSVLSQVKTNSRTAQIPIIVFTASANTDKKSMALELGAADYLTKPVSAEDLRNTVARVLKEKGEK